jgi:hypothetical protein
VKAYSGVDMGCQLGHYIKAWHLGLISRITLSDTLRSVSPMTLLCEPMLILPRHDGADARC